MDLVQVGVDHHTAPLALRERIAIPTDRQREVIETFAAEPWLAEVFVVSTCNRTEVLATGTEGPAYLFGNEDLEEVLMEWINGRRLGVVGGQCDELAGR